MPLATTTLKVDTNVAGVSTLATIATALNNIVSGASGEAVHMNSADEISLKEGIITKSSNNDMLTTYSKIKTTITNNPNLTVVAELDHQANAASVGMTLRPTKLIIFGNPQLGSPLMLEMQSIAIDLPQKMLVYEDENGTVNVAYNDPTFLADRHDIEGNKEILQTIATALDNISTSGTE